MAGTQRLRGRTLTGALAAIAFASLCIFAGTRILAVLGWDSVEVTIVVQATVVGATFLLWLAAQDRPIREQGTEAPTEAQTEAQTEAKAQAVSSGPPRTDLPVLPAAAPSAESKGRELVRLPVAAEQPRFTPPAVSQPSEQPARAPASITAVAQEPQGRRQSQQQVVHMVQVQRIWRVSTSTNGAVQVRLSSGGNGTQRVLLESAGSEPAGDRSFDVAVARALAQALLEACDSAWGPTERMAALGVRSVASVERVFR